MGFSLGAQIIPAVHHLTSSELVFIVCAFRMAAHLFCCRQMLDTCGAAVLCIMGCLAAFLPVTFTSPKLDLRPAFYKLYPRTYPLPHVLRPVTIPAGVGVALLTRCLHLKHEVWSSVL